MTKEIENIQNMLDVQLADGNWNYDPYMFGMANGMILCMATLKGEEPKYLEAPDKWMSDLSDFPTKDKLQEDTSETT